MRYLITLGFILLFDWYAYQAFQVISDGWTDQSRILLNFVYWSVPLLALGTIIWFNQTKGEIRNEESFSLLRALLIIAYISKFIIIIFLLLEDLIHGLISLFYFLFSSVGFEGMRSVLVAQAAIVFAAVPFFMLVYGMIRNRYRYTVYKENVFIEGLPEVLEGLKIVQISDIHSGSFTDARPIKAGIDLINQQEPDLVFFTGDLVNNVAREMYPYIDVFKKIKSKYGVYSITGNHDYGDYVRWENPEAKNANFQELINVHRLLGWNLLLNENSLVTIKGKTVAIIGVENYSASARFSKYGDLHQAFRGSESAVLKLLLSHDPSHWEDQVIKEFRDIAITFSGHTHGFQFGLEIPGWIKWSPSKYVYKQWAGLYQSGKQFLYVNRGFGFLGYPGRVGILPEITFLELKSAKTDS